MKKTTTRLMLLLLIFVMCLPLAVACAKPGDNGNDTTLQGDNADVTTTPIEITAPVDENGYLLDNLPSELNFGDEQVNILATKQQKTQNFAEATTGDIVNDAIYNRQMKVETRLGVRLNWIFEDGNWDSRASFIKLCETDFNNNVGAYDLVVAYNLIPPAMAISGYNENLYQNEYLELDKPWWPSTYVENAMYNNSIYCLAESSSRGVLRNMMCIFFDKTLVSNLGLENPYTLVTSGQWTIGKLFEMAKKGYSNLDGNGTVDVLTDQFGLCSATKPYLDSYFYGMGFTLTEPDESGTPVFVLGEEKINDYIKMMTDNLFGEQAIVAVDKSQYKMFIDGRAVFYHTAVAITDKMRDLKKDYGIAPMPKLNEEQEDYYTALSNTHDVWCILSSARDIEKSSAVLEAMASEAYRQIYPAYFEMALKVKYAESPDLGAIYDIIRDGIIFDIGYLYSCAFARMPMLYLRDCVGDNDPNWASKWNTVKDGLNAELETILSQIEKHGG